MLKIYDFSVDYITNPTLIKRSGLRFGWKLTSDRANVLQKGYKITVSNQNDVIFDSGFINSSDFFDISFEDLLLSSKTDYTINLSVKDNYGDIAEYSHSVSTEI